MECKALEERLIKEFVECVGQLKEEALNAAGSIRVLADISTVLMALWHPSIQKHFEYKTEVASIAAQSYLDEVKKMPSLDSSGKEG